MTGKFLLLSTICLSALTVKANDTYMVSDSISKQVSVTSEQYLQTLKPTYLTNVSEAANCMCPKAKNGPGDPSLLNHEWCSAKAQINGSLSHITAIFGFTLAGLIVQDIINKLSN